MLQCQKDKFSLPDGLHYLNTAYMSPLPKDTEEEGVRLLKRKNDPSQIKAEDFFDSSNALRKEFGKLVGVSNYQQIAIVPSVSYGIANAANNIELSPHDEIVLTGEQFPSNVYVWMEKAKTSGAKVITVDAPDSIDNRAKKWNERILDAIGDKTKVVTMAHVHWTDGTLFDLEAISKRVKEVGGYLIIDGTQSIGALPFDVGRVKPDALICAGYKWLLGPYGIGLGYYLLSTSKKGADIRFPLDPVPLRIDNQFGLLVRTGINLYRLKTGEVDFSRYILGMSFSYIPKASITASNAQKVGTVSTSNFSISLGTIIGSNHAGTGE